MNALVAILYFVTTSEWSMTFAKTKYQSQSLVQSNKHSHGEQRKCQVIINTQCCECVNVMCLSGRQSVMDVLPTQNGAAEPKNCTAEPSKVTIYWWSPWKLDMVPQFWSHLSTQHSLTSVSIHHVWLIQFTWIFWRCVEGLMLLTERWWDKCYAEQEEVYVDQSIGIHVNR